jgi:uncharacterized protein
MRPHALAFSLAFLLTVLAPAAGAPLRVLFLGDNGHHQPAARLRALAPAMIDRGIHIVYTEDTAVLGPDTLRRYDAVLVYANLDTLEPDAEAALLGYVAGGGGLVALHSASFCFRNSERYIAMVGAQFRSHGTGVVRTRLADPEHPVVRGFTPFESWDETYVHTRHNPTGRTVLEYRDEEPWTWIRTEGAGRVFYTAWGHDDRTWRQPGFHDLVERGIRYAAGQTLPDALATRPTVPTLTRVAQAGIPYYTPGQRTQGEGSWPEIQRPLSPEDSLKRLVVPAGFAVELVAAEPEIRKPIAMAWDERGRLWIAESLDYPNTVREAGGGGRDRLLICEDADGDGRMDRFTVFADGLNIPTGFAFSRGGVVVLHAPDTLFLKDVDGDDRADVREPLFTGWSRSDTHAGPSNLVPGLDNHFWGTVGYAGFSGSVGGEALGFRQGFFRFAPDGSRLEFLRATNNNTWGLGFTEEGHAFASTANNNPSVYLPPPNRVYLAAGLEPRTLGTIADTSRFLALTPRVRQVDVHWGYTAAAGHAFYTARAFPREYWNRVAFVAEPTGHLVGEFQIEADGANFRSRNPSNLIASDDEWYAPIMAEVGPDGAVWVIDWYNYIVQHNPTPKGFSRGPGNAYENPLRDQRHGRIHRVVWKGGGTTPAPRPPPLASATVATLVETLAHDNLLWRRHAQRLLVERGRKDVVPALLNRVRDSSLDALGLNPGALHALWTLHGLHAIDTFPEVLRAATDALAHPSPAVRRGALAVLPRTPDSLRAIIKAGVLSDADAQVRCAALLALAAGPALKEAGAALVTTLDQPGLRVDRWTADAARAAAATQHHALLAAIPAPRLDEIRARKGRGSARPESFDTVPPFESFESFSPGEPAGWTTAATTGTVSAAVVEDGRSSRRSLRLQAGPGGGDAAIIRTIAVRPRTRYDLGVWIRTEDIGTAGGALGALLRVNGVPGASSVASTGTTSWSLARISLDSGERTELTLACILGGGAAATGTAWFDDLTLIDQGPADERIDDPLGAAVAHALTRTGAAGAVEDPDRDLPILTLGVVPDAMRYDRTELAVRAGQRVRLVFRNTDHMPHNALLLRPGTTEVVGALADAMLTDPRALARNYAPDTPDVLALVPLVNPGENAEVVFNAPAVPGVYPIICTFPGHWRIMQTTLRVR